jgi:thiamine-phosphate pyrophosphorylase
MNLLSEQLLLYAVTDQSRLGKLSLIQALEEALEAGVTLVQYREKELPQDELEAEARRLHEVTMRYGVPLIINDDVEVAFRAEAEGVHLGQEDAAISYARRLLGPDKIIGVTAHTVAEALAAEAAGADYLGAGAVFQSTTKNNTIPMSFDTLTAICNAVTIPVVAIGGITKENIMTLQGSGISGVAVVSAIFAVENIGNTTKELMVLAKKMTSSKANNMI